jgi:NADH:ubiquinone reductase (H+-translocating)
VASPAGDWLCAKTDRAGRVRVDPDLSVPGHPDIFVIGDADHAVRAGDKAFPGVAPGAKQQGNHMAKLARGAPARQHVAAAPL